MKIPIIVIIKFPLSVLFVGSVMKKNGLANAYGYARAPIREGRSGTGKV
jgi:hypothetical protein